MSETAPISGQGASASPSSTPVPIGVTVAPGTTAEPLPNPKIDWLTGANDDITGFVQNKGWKSSIEVVEGYRNLEKHMGVPADKLLRMPDWDRAEKSELDQFFGKLGRPSEANGYDIKLAEGTPTEYLDAAKNKFHEIGLTDRQAKELVKWNDEYANMSVAKQNEQFQQNVALQDAELRKEWGSAYDQELASARNAAKALGIKVENIDKLERTLGYADLMRMMSNIGKRIGEDSFVSGANSQSGAMTPAMAKARVAQLQTDKEWTAKYLSGNIESRAEMERLMKFAYPS